jgi:hypothetical protein
VLPAERRDRIQIEDVAQSVRDHHSLHLRAVGRFKLRSIDLIRWQRHIDEDGDQTVLKDWIDRRRKAGCNGKHLVARTKLSFAQLGRGKRAERNQIC